eukprot:TRINITY_DN420_c0_g1_i5.p1 TRINITY_DN420_c0_g1~~TRINITY_DN420_c0_g1_i5.p1  ORF type:complete len:296 (+),score=34.74 TRINITY_DN420_c0_g1_i5:170-1057(+)
MEKLGESSAVLSPANRRVHSNPFASIPPKQYGLPERNEPDLGWFATARRHQFLLFMLAILTFLCTVYLYFAITFQAADSCAGLRGQQKAACQIARTKANLSHRRLLSGGRISAGTPDTERNSLPYVAAFLGKVRSASAGRRVEKVDPHVSLRVEERMKMLLKVKDADQVSFADLIKNYAAPVSSENPKVGVRTRDDWCGAGQSSVKKYDVVPGYGILASKRSRCQITDVLSNVCASLQPGGYVLLWDRADLIEQALKLAPSFAWTTLAHYTSSETDRSIVAFQSSQPAELTPRLE